MFALHLHPSTNDLEKTLEFCAVKGILKIKEKSKLHLIIGNCYIASSTLGQVSRVECNKKSALCLSCGVVSISIFFL